MNAKWSGDERRYATHSAPIVSWTRASAKKCDGESPPHDYLFYFAFCLYMSAMVSR